jgi:FtsZ-binding cell division protein ZapB
MKPKKVKVKITLEALADLRDEIKLLFHRCDALNREANNTLDRLRRVAEERDLAQNQRDTLYAFVNMVAQDEGNVWQDDAKATLSSLKEEA